MAVLTQAEQMLDRAVADDAWDGESPHPEQVRVVRAAWNSAHDVWTGPGPLDTEVDQRVSLLLGRVALLGRAAGLDRSALSTAAGALRGVVARSAPVQELRGPCLEVLAAILVELADDADTDGEIDRSQAADLLEEAVGLLDEARDVVHDPEDRLELSGDIAQLVYRAHLLRDRCDSELLDVVIAELGDLLQCPDSTPEVALALGDVLEDRWLRAHDDADRNGAVQVATDLLATPGLAPETAAAARSLRGRLWLAEPSDPSVHDEAIADLTVAVDVLGPDDLDGWAATYELAVALLRRGLRDDAEAALAVRCLRRLEATPGADPAEHAELVQQVALAVLQRMYLSNRWDEAYLPALQLLCEYADGGGADPQLVAMAGIAMALRGASLFLTGPRPAAEPVLEEAAARLEMALQRPGLDEAAVGLHALAGTVLWLRMTPDDWAPTVSLSETMVARADQPLLPAARRDLARAALDHFRLARARPGDGVEVPHLLVVVLDRMVHGEHALSEEDLALLQVPQSVDSDLFAAMASDVTRGQLLAVEAYRRGDVALLREGIDAMRHGLRDIDQRHPVLPHARLALAHSLGRLVRLTGEMEPLIEAHELVRVVRRGSHGSHFDTLLDEISRELLAVGSSDPATAGERRGGTEPHEDQREEVPDDALAEALVQEARQLRQVGDPAARRRARAALRAYGRCVLVEPDAMTALAIAERAHLWSAEVAGWSIDDGCADLAVELLEHGRAMLLHAATATADGARILRESGREDLAQAWLTGRLDASARQQLLSALADTPAGHMLAAVPEPYQIGAAVFEVGADALVYLLDAVRPHDSGWAGQALVTRPGGGVDALELRADRPPPGKGGDPAADAALADWAEQAFGATLRTHIAGWDLPHVPGIVLVPLGGLAAVPWAAARRSTPDGWRYLIHDVRISYAASARQVVDVSRRGCLDRHDAVIVANPGGDLPYAARAAVALRDLFYPQATCAGLPTGRLGPGRGGVEDVLAAFGSDGRAAGVLHLSAHAVLDAAPDRSRVLLADGEALQVVDLLAHARRRGSAASGGLVVLGCCATDRTSRLPDEALTLATAVLAAGAVGVVGTRRPVADGVAAVFAFVLHHHLAMPALSVAEALRRSQLWMLDPERRLPEGLPTALADVVAATDLADPSLWAFWTHHGR